MVTMAPVVQVLSRNNYKTSILSCFQISSLQALASSSIWTKSTILPLTMSYFLHARVGNMLGWWDVHPLPPSILAEYWDPKKFGRISAWGYGEVVESNISGIEVGTLIFGYLPIGALPLEMEVKLSTNGLGRFFEVSKHWENQLPVYNR